jgi:hypothetical protein
MLTLCRLRLAFKICHLEVLDVQPLPDMALTLAQTCAEAGAQASQAAEGCQAGLILILHW